MSENFRQNVMTEVLKLISDQWIEVDGKRLQIRTALSEDYDASRYPWLAPGQPDAPDKTGEAEFDIVSPLPDPFPTDYRYRVVLTET